jgi:hypothetical protein
MTSPDEKQDTAFISSGLSTVHLSESMNSVKLDFPSALTPGETMCIVLPADCVRPIRELLEQMEKEIARRAPPPTGRH